MTAVAWAILIYISAALPPDSPSPAESRARGFCFLVIVIITIRDLFR